MDFIEFTKKYYFHDEEIKNIVFDETLKTLRIDVDFCAWQLTDLRERGLHYSKLEMVFKDVEQLRSYADISTIIDDENDIRFIYCKQNKRKKKTHITFGLDHWMPNDPQKKIGNWFFIEFFAADVETTERE